MIRHKHSTTIQLGDTYEFCRQLTGKPSEDVYGEDLDSGYGKAVELPQTIRPVDLDPCDLFEEIYNKVIVQGER